MIWYSSSLLPCFFPMFINMYGGCAPYFLMRKFQVFLNYFWSNVVIPRGLSWLLRQSLDGVCPLLENALGSSSRKFSKKHFHLNFWLRIRTFGNLKEKEKGRQEDSTHKGRMTYSISMRSYICQCLQVIFSSMAAEAKVGLVFYNPRDKPTILAT